MASPAAISEPVNVFEQFHWEPQPEAERWLTQIIQDGVAGQPWLKDFADRLANEAGVRVGDIIGEVQVGQDAIDSGALERAGWRPVGRGVYRNPSGIFPAVRAAGVRAARLGVRVDSVVDFLAASGTGGSVRADARATYRSASCGGWRVETIEGGDAAAREASAVDYEWYVYETHGASPFGADQTTVDVEAATRWREAFRLRSRGSTAVGNSDKYDFRITEKLIDAAIADLGVDYACDLFFAAEREFWQRRNRAAQVQKARQDKLGIGWANHDHHTYRSSRRHFARLVAIWEKLGFVCRERFYAGREAGWGAQVMEQPTAGIVTFNDVDLSPDELLIDFAHEPLPERHDLGTVGLWCGLHGESFLEAGMHHLECTFDFAALKEQLERDHGVSVMKPFTDFPYLKQAFTQGERWPVKEERIVRLLEKGQITAELADKFRREGAIGSHLENLERNQGFKGFNQTGVSEIIAATDPRKQVMR
jgi:hypothetical protein